MLIVLAFCMFSFSRSVPYACSNVHANVKLLFNWSNQLHNNTSLVYFCWLKSIVETRSFFVFFSARCSNTSKGPKNANAIIFYPTKRVLSSVELHSPSNFKIWTPCVLESLRDGFSSTNPFSNLSSIAFLYNIYLSLFVLKSHCSSHKFL